MGTQTVQKVKSRPAGSSTKTLIEDVSSSQTMCGRGAQEIARLSEIFDHSDGIVPIPRPPSASPTRDSRVMLDPVTLVRQKKRAREKDNRAERKRLTKAYLLPMP